MFRLRLQARTCLSCGVCEDVCVPDAIRMHTADGRRVEGPLLSYLLLNGPANEEHPPSAMAAFPFLASPSSCNGCHECIEQCPVGALELLLDGQPGRGARATSTRA